MGTQASLELVGAEPECDHALLLTQAIFASVTQSMSPWIATSDVTRINQSAGSSTFVTIAPSTFAVLAAARTFSERTDGLFDITYASAAKLGANGFTHVVLDQKSSGARIDRAGGELSLNGIAKGYAVDQAVTVLRAAGFQHFVLRAGGDLFAAGKRGARPWRIGVRDPRDATQTFAELLVEDGAFSTSGDYERGKHIVDPRTAQPALASRSVSIAAMDCITAEALSKALFIAGKEGMTTILPRFPGAGAVIVDADNLVHVSSALGRRLTRTRAPTP